MKTLVLATVSAAALLVAGAASAQTVSGNITAYRAGLVGERADSDQTSYVNQNGNNNSATIDQIAGKKTTESSTVLQYWPSNYSDSYAAAGDHAANNNAYVKQNGAGAQRSVIMQANYGSYAGNTSDVTQSGTGKQDALSYQFGNNNYSSIRQLGGKSANTGFQVKTVDDHANGEAVASSLHSQDAALQQYDQGGARVVQDETTGSVAEITQTADSVDSGATIAQWHATKDSTQVKQSGTGDRSASYQNGHDNYIGVDQSGSYDLAVTVQVGEGSGSGATDATHNNFASVKQSGTDDQALSRQSGNNNALYINQKGTSDYSTIDQSGALQTADLTQSGFADGSAVTQKGMMNVSYTKQSGDGDTSIIDQTGAGGAYNTVNVNQSSNYAWSQAIQNGYGNFINVHQH